MKEINQDNSLHTCDNLGSSAISNTFSSSTVPLSFLKPQTIVSTPARND